MSIQRPTNSKGCARVFLRHLYEKVGETGRAIPPLEYNTIASVIGLSFSEMSDSLKDLKQDLLIAYPNPATEFIVLTKAGVERADYLKFRQEFPLVGDPLPDSLEDIRAEIRFWAQERSRHDPRSTEWQLISARVDDLKHLENATPKRQPDTTNVEVSSSSRSSVAPAISKWYLDVRKVLREIYRKALDADKAWKTKDNGSAETIVGYLKKDYQQLQELWAEKTDSKVPSGLGRHIAWGQANDMIDILWHDLPEVEEQLDGVLAEAAEKTGDEGILHLLHPAIVKSSYDLFLSGHLRDAVLNSVVAILI